MSSVELQSYAPVGGRDSRSPSLDDLSIIGRARAASDEESKEATQSLDEFGLPTIDSTGHHRTVAATSSSSGSDSNVVDIEPFRAVRFDGNVARLDPNSEEAQGIVVDHTRNQCRCCCNILLSLPNAVMTVLVIYYTVSTWAAIDPINGYGVEVSPWRMAPKASLSSSVSMGTGCSAKLVWPPSSNNHTDTFTIDDCQSVKKTRVLLGFACTFATIFPLITIVVALFKHRMSVLHRIAALESSLLITVLFSKLAIDAWKGSRGLLIASSRNRLQLWTTTSTSDTGDSMLGVICLVMGPVLFLLNAICGFFPRRRRRARESHVAVVT